MTASLGWSIPGYNLDLLLGPVFLANCFNYALYGLLCLQVFLYYVCFPNDAPRFKTLVYSVFIIDSASIACATYNGYWVFVKNWGNTEVFHNLGWSWATVPTSSGLVALIVQSFFAYRIWKISHNWWMPCFIVLLSTIACGFAFGAANIVAHLQSYTYIRRLIPSIWLSFGICADFFVCSTLVYYLLKSPVSFNLTNRIIVRLVRIAVETALVTIVAATIKLYLIFSRHDNMHLLFCLLLSRLYSNAMLGTLNSRSAIFGGGKNFGADDSTFSNTSPRRFWSSRRPSSGIESGISSHPSIDKSNNPREIAIKIDTSATSHTDLEADLASAKVPVYPLIPISPPASAKVFN